MIENREKEWQELEANIKRIFNNLRFLPKDETTTHFIPTLHLWISPSFTPDIDWVFYNPRLQISPQPKPRIRQLIWEKQKDFKRLNDPLIGLRDGFHTEPTFNIKTVELELEIFGKIHDDLAKIHLPAFVKDEILGLDGEKFGVETLGFYYNTKISWWSSYPDEWQELVDWFEKIRKFLEEKINDY